MIIFLLFCETVNFLQEMSSWPSLLEKVITFMASSSWGLFLDLAGGHGLQKQQQTLRLPAFFTSVDD